MYSTALHKRLAVLQELLVGYNEPLSTTDNRLRHNHKAQRKSI
jgi:hypothetical protein